MLQLGHQVTTCHSVQLNPVPLFLRERSRWLSIFPPDLERLLG
jgi:hypothetical protein